MAIRENTASDRAVNRRVRRAGGFAVVGALALAAPALGPASAAPFVVVAGLAAFVIDDGPVFELFARPGEHEEHTLYGLVGFSLAAAGLGLLVALFDLPLPVFLVSVLVLSAGDLAEAVAEGYRSTAFATTAFVVVGAAAGLAGQLLVGLATPDLVSRPAFVAFLAASAALVAALVRTGLSPRDDALVLFSAGLTVWLLTALPIDPSPATVLAAAVVSAGFGGLAYALGVASVSGMLTGVLAALVMVVLGGFGWFALLIAFFGIGGLSTRFGYDRKQERGLAEANDGARGSANVLANAAVALAAVVGYAASPLFPMPRAIFLYVFAGSLAAAMADTLSSEVGGLYDTPRLVTTLEPVPPGTDGGVTWQGGLAGVGGAALVAGLAVLALGTSPAGALVICAAGVVGTLVDSLLGALVENHRIDAVVGRLAPDLGEHRVGNTAVNFLTTLVAAVVCAVLAVVVGLAPL